MKFAKPVYFLMHYKERNYLNTNSPGKEYVEVLYMGKTAKEQSNTKSVVLRKKRQVIADDEEDCKDEACNADEGLYC